MGGRLGSRNPQRSQGWGWGGGRLPSAPFCATWYLSLFLTWGAGEAVKQCACKLLSK